MLKNLTCLICCLLFMISSVYADKKYYLCGPDEDGCAPDEYPYCVCIKQNETYSAQPYCLDFDNLTCKPLTLSPHCSSDLMFSDQGKCLATIFQSEPEPPCTLTDKSFCIENHITRYEEAGSPSKRGMTALTQKTGANPSER